MLNYELQQISLLTDKDKIFALFKADKDDNEYDYYAAELDAIGIAKSRSDAGIGGLTTGTDVVGLTLEDGEYHIVQEDINYAGMHTATQLSEIQETKNILF